MMRSKNEMHSLILEIAAETDAFVGGKTAIDTPLATNLAREIIMNM